MKRLKDLFYGLALLALFCIIALKTSAQPRFFKANSLEYYYRWREKRWIPLEGEDRWDKDDVRYGKSWLGNDTIVDGKECVEVWEKLSENEDALILGFIYEDNEGYVYRMYPNLIPEDYWYFLYDFSRSDWNIGDSLVFVQSPWGIFKQRIEKISEFRLLTGETLPVFDGLIYGLGHDFSIPFYNGWQWHEQIEEAELLRIYKYGQLIYSSETGVVCEPVIVDVQNDGGFDLSGRPADGTQKGVIVKNGKKVVIK